MLAVAFFVVFIATCDRATRFHGSKHERSNEFLELELTASGKQQKWNQKVAAPGVIGSDGVQLGVVDMGGTPMNDSSRNSHGSSRSVAGNGTHELAVGTNMTPVSDSTQTGHGYPRSGTKMVGNQAEEEKEEEDEEEEDEQSSVDSSTYYSDSPGFYTSRNPCGSDINPFKFNGEQDSKPAEGKIISGTLPRGPRERIQYKYLKFLDMGGFGEVWTVTEDLDAATPQPTAAIKVSKETSDEMPERNEKLLWKEACAMIKCSGSPYVVTMQEGFMDKKGRYYIVMEYVSGGSLESNIKSKTISLKKTPHALAQIFLDILTGLEYIHQQGWSHRDMKPENVLITNNRRAKIADLGLASDTQTVKRGRVGTLPFMAPELHDNAPYYGPDVDIFALGIILYCMVTHKLPYPKADTYPHRKSGYYGKRAHSKALKNVPNEIQEIIECTQRELREAIECKESLALKAANMCRCEISDIKQNVWIKDAIARDPGDPNAQPQSEPAAPPRSFSIKRALTGLAA